MKNSLMRAMKASISEVLEKMFFMPIEIFEDDISNQFAVEKPDVNICRLSFTGPFSGSLYAFCPENLQKVLSVNFLGVEEHEITESQGLEVLKEMTNIITGNIFTKFDASTEFKLGIPEIITDKSSLQDTPGNIDLYVETFENIIRFTVETK